MVGCDRIFYLPILLKERTEPLVHFGGFGGFVGGEHDLGEVVGVGDAGGLKCDRLSISGNSRLVALLLEVDATYLSEDIGRV